MRFQGQTILVTGASAGIGAAVTRRLAEEGARIILVARGAERLKEARSQLPPGDYLSCSCDVAKDEEIKTLFADLQSQSLHLNGLVHCAGTHSLRPLKLIEPEYLATIWQSHVLSLTALARRFAYGGALAPQGGAIVGISSTAAIRGEPGTAAYSAAKGAVISLARTLAVELAGRKIRVNTITPGLVETAQSQTFLKQMRSEQVEAIRQAHLLGFGQPEDVAAAATFLIADEARWITGTNLIVDGGYNA